MAETIQGIIKDSHAEVAKELSEEVGFRLFPGDEHLLTDPNILGVKAGTHVIYRAHTNNGRTYPMVVSKDVKMRGEFFI
jgi:hypothetical protein